jgi:small subunit ribosomal protein S2
MPSVTVRWLGGMLTNWRTIRQRINELERLERMRDRGEFERLTKKEALNLNRQIERLDMLLGGIRSMVRLPELLFVVDVHREQTAIHEANLLNIPVIAMVDTNCNPNYIDYVIPSNDDAIRAIKLLVGKIADACLEGRAMRKEEESEQVIEAQLPMVEEAELSDEELLGEATLAKLASRTVLIKAEDEEVEVPFELEKEVEEIGEDEIEEEVVEEVVEEEEAEE